MPVAAQATAPLPPNPFADFHTLRLANGLKVWYRQLPGSGVAAVALTVPYGWDRDARGREGTAHFLEHVLLSDREGRTDAELRRELEARGGSFGGTTSADRTTYNVLIDGDDAAYGIRWLGAALAPRVLTQELLERTREPVAIETQARRRSPLQKLVRAYLLHPALRPPGFWQREFGLDVWQERLVERHDALHAIRARDLQDFYDTYYVPQQMTLLVVGDVAWRDLEGALQETFGTLPWRPTPPPPPAVHADSQHRARYYWSTGRNTRLRVRYRITDLNSLDDQRLIFLEDLLTRRLFERLRLAGSSLVYDVAAYTETRGRAGYFTLATAITPGSERAARAVIDAELERLRRAPADTAFYDDRDALARRLRLQNATAGALQGWLLHRFYEPTRHDVFPDLGSYYATLGADSIAAFADRLFARDNTIIDVVRPLPLAPAWLALLALAVMTAAVLLYRRLHLRAIDMSEVRFIGRLRPPPLFAAARLTFLALAVGIGGRLLAAGVEHVADRWLFAVDSFALHVAAVLALLGALAFAALALAGIWPRKIMVFERELRIKSLTYRSAVTALEDVTDVRLATPEEARRHVHQLRGHAYGGREGVLIERRSGAALLYRVRDNAALLRALREQLARLRATAVQPAAEVSSMLHAEPDDGPAPPVNGT